MEPTPLAARSKKTRRGRPCSLRNLARARDHADPRDRRHARSLDRRLRYWSSLKLLVLDELGYLSYDARNADLLFQVVSRRYERKSLVLTTNLAFKDWPTIFPNSACTTALIDRIVHHSDVIVIEGDSYRRREAKKKTRSRRTKTEPSKD